MNIINYADGKKLNIDRKETFRYLGYHFGGSVPDDPELDKMVTELEKKLKEAVTPRCAYEIYALEVKDDSCVLSSDKQVLMINSARLSAHIRGCRNAILFAATLGPGADMLIRRYNGRSTIKPAILQAVGAAAIEAFADEVTDIIRSNPDTSDLKMRFSPGYGDFSLEYQNDFFSLLSLEKNLGMSLNSALLMSPSKSITAVIGVI
ncbi:MAG: Vitamin B12 dependent methionine synthase activation subunit, partial [Lachnospiraceae bacterium]|nr:Vitamin B12 dependent methionine synthase activation subunit [Lachnospiraceae bacterium]MBR4144392.1 Vitamin B12 dependent methionine synthase activation subunit [Lachnospiraceae bacterium]